MNDRVCQEADWIPIWWAANQWNRHTCTARNKAWRYNWWAPATDRRCLLEREPAILLPELSFSQPRRCSQLENCDLFPPLPDYYSIVFSVLSFSPSHSFIVQRVTVFVHRYIAFFKLNSQWCILIEFKCRWDGEKILVLWKYPFSPLVPCSFSSYLYIPVSYSTLTV